MADHRRRAIREAVATAVTGLTTTGSRVYQSRVYTLQRANLPGLRVFAGDETIEAVTIHGPTTQDRKLRIRVEAVAQALQDAVSALDDTLDGIVKEVEIAVAGMSLSGLADSIHLTDVSEPEYSDQGELPTGSVTITFEANYYTAANAPDVAL